jgi:glycosyltransferase involved in cell wall biosynthesis
MKKRLLFCAYNLDLGGVEQALVNLLNLIDKDKYEITLVLEKKEGLFLDQLNSEIKVKEVKVSSQKNILIRKLINFYRKFKWVIFNYNKYDFSCCYTTYSLSSNLIARVSSKNNALYIHNDYTKIYNKKKLSKIYKLYNVNKFLRLIFVSNESKNNILKIFPYIKDKSFVINNFIDLNKIEKLSKESTNLKKDLLYKDFMFIGRIDEHQKKLSRMIDLFYEFNKRNLKYRLYIIGDGPDKNIIQKKIEEKKLEKIVFLLGKKKNPYPYIKFTDYILFTSDYEGFPVVYNEAIYLNKLIFSTIDASDDDIKLSNGYGIIIPKEIIKMADIIEKTIDDNIKPKKHNYIVSYESRMNKLESIFDYEIGRK